MRLNELLVSKCLPFLSAKLSNVKVTQNRQSTYCQCIFLTKWNKLMKITNGNQTNKRDQKRIIAFGAFYTLSIRKV